MQSGRSKKKYFVKFSWGGLSKSIPRKKQAATMTWHNHHHRSSSSQSNYEVEFLMEDHSNKNTGIIHVAICEHAGSEICGLNISVKSLLECMSVTGEQTRGRGRKRGVCV